MWKTLVLFAFVATLTTVAGYEPENVEDSKAPDVSVATHDTVTADISTHVETNGCGCPPICGKNEEYNNCTDTGCTVTRCSQVGYPLDCDNYKCSPGCACKDGYARDDKDNCIPIRDCPSCGGDKNAIQGCSNYCGHTCATYNNPPAACPLFCVYNGCACKSGFVYDTNIKACVKPKDCTPTCPANEEYSFCTNGGCDARNCSQFGKPVPCVKLDPKACIKGCVCVAGFLRASNGTCIPKDKCGPKNCGNNEYWEPCIVGCSNQSCSDVGYPPRSCPAQIVGQCKSGCRCKDGYCRDSNKACVVIPKCGLNEAFNFCMNPECKASRCSELGFPLNCDKCKPQCACRSGFLRADNGTCVLASSCPSCGGDVNAQAGCGTNCGSTCATYNKPRTPCNCVPNGCSCKTGFVFDDNIKACVKFENCTPVCKKNEQYSPCTNGGCDARNCSQLGKPVPCVKLDPKACIKGCVCAPGYLRATNGTCVPKDQCAWYPPICPTNEEYNNCTDTGCTVTRCTQVGYPLDCDNYKCSPGCACKDGYARADNGTCIPIRDCPSCGGDKKAHFGCSNYCSHSCSDYNLPPKPCPLFCMYNGCDCDEGFVYDYNIKACVKPKDCTPVCKKNEQYSPCTNGGCDARNCSQLGKPVPCVKLDPKACIKGCVCAPGYLRATNGTCVPKDQCAWYPPICPTNEEYNNCTDTGCTVTRCTQVGYPLDCDNYKCSPGCACKDGYARADNGTCIPIRDCPSCGGDKKAHFGCSNYCSHSCSDYNLPPKPCPLFCMYNGCDCDKGFVYDYNIKACVKPKDCTPTCPANEEYSPCTNGGCDARNCSQFGKPVPCVKLDPKTCIKGCVCVAGFLRTSNGTCVPKDECGPPANQCGPNQVFSNCTNGGCDARNCSQAGKPVPCVKLDPKNCIKGCVCQSGYLKTKEGKCVLKNQCNEGCGNDPNAHPGCGVNCGKTCEKRLICPRICKVDGCDCNDNYFLDSNVGKCVLQKDCTPICGLNEVYSSCINGGCGYKNCSQLGQPELCVDPIPGGCIKGCLCASGYLRAANGTCIPQDQCPKTGCNGDPNAHSGCGVNCGRTCATYKIKGGVACPAICYPDGCDCNDCYVYDDIAKKCVLPGDCTQENVLFGARTECVCELQPPSPAGQLCTNRLRAQPRRDGILVLGAWRSDATK